MTAAKKIVYLVGAGATQGEINYLGAPVINMLMGDSPTLGNGVATRIREGLTKNEKELLGSNAVIDIEKVISLLSSCGVNRMTNLAEKLRRAYFEDLRGNIPARILRRPRLAEALFELHKVASFSGSVEHLSCVLTTNHDGLFQLASQRVFGGLHVGVSFESDTFTHKETVPPILQLHGSFTWSFGIPMTIKPISRQSVYSRDIAWIPPTIAKESKQFPFNKLMGMAYEALAKQCDVLRVIGASLTQNDWNILSLIFNAQKHRELTKGAAFRIELLMPMTAGEAIKQQCSYLKKMVSIGHLTEGDFSPYLDDPIPLGDPEVANPFAYWLKQKVQFHRARGHLENGLGGGLAEVIGEAA